MSFRIGEPIDDFTFERPEGGQVHLSSFRGRPLLVVFMRHVACIACRWHLDELHTVYPKIKELGGEVLAVTATPAKNTAPFLKMRPQPFPVVCDDTHAAYDRFALKRTTWWRMFNPAVLAGFIGIMFRGWMPVAPVRKNEDVLQLGGDFLLDADGRLRFAYASAEATDRPSAQQVVEEFRAVHDSPTLA